MRPVALALMLVCAISITFGQELRVKSFWLTGDVLHGKQIRKDVNDAEAAVVKVLLPVPGATFDGNLIGEPKYYSSEYWVWLEGNAAGSGTGMFDVRCPGVPTLRVDFSSFGIKRLKSKGGYELALEIPERLLYGSAQHVVPRDIHRGPLKGSFKLSKPEGVQLWYIHTSTGKRDYVPLQKNDVWYATMMEFSIPEAVEGDSLMLGTYNNAYSNQAVPITLKDIVNETITPIYPVKRKRRPFKAYAVDVLTGEPLSTFYISLFEKAGRGGLDDFVESYFTFYAIERNNPAEMWKQMEIDKTYVVKFANHENQPYRGLWDWDEKVEIKPFEESDVVVKVRPTDVPALDFWIATKEDGREIKVSPVDAPLPQYYQWQDKSDKNKKIHVFGSYFNFKAFPVQFPAVYSFSADGCKTAQVTFYENPPYEKYIGSLKSGKTMLMLTPGSPSDIEIYEYCNGKFRKKK